MVLGRAKLRNLRPDGVATRSYICDGASSPSGLRLLLGTGIFEP